MTSLDCQRQGQGIAASIPREAWRATLFFLCFDHLHQQVIIWFFHEKMIRQLISKNSLLIWSCWPCRKNFFRRWSCFEMRNATPVFPGSTLGKVCLVGIRFEKGCWATFGKNWFGAEQSCYIEYSSGCLDCGSCLFFSHFCRYCGSIVVASEKIRWFQIWGKNGVKLCKKWLVLSVLNMKRFTQRYCWGKKSCTTFDAKNPVNNGIQYLSTGAGFLA